MAACWPTNRADKARALRCLTLNRGEGGANVMSPDYFDALGLVRTMELLAAGRYYGVDQYWTRVIDYGFSKTKAESIGKWTHDRVLYDVVRVVRMVRPLVITSVFVGGPSDGHGNHQTAGAMAQEVFKAAGDPNVFPDQIEAGLRPWTPLKDYARAPMGRRGGNSLSVNLQIPEGTTIRCSAPRTSRSPAKDWAIRNRRTAAARSPTPARCSARYHRFGSVVPAQDKEESFFDGIDISLMGIATLAGSGDTAFLTSGLTQINAAVEEAISKYSAQQPEATAPALARGLTATASLLDAVAKSTLSEEAKYNIRHELKIKRVQFNDALAEALGLSVSANVAPDVESNSPFRMRPRHFPRRDPWTEIRREGTRRESDVDSRDAARRDRRAIQQERTMEHCSGEARCSSRHRRCQTRGYALQRDRAGQRGLYAAVLLPARHRTALITTLQTINSGTSRWHPIRSLPGPISSMRAYRFASASMFRPSSG